MVQIVSQENLTDDQRRQVERVARVHRQAVLAQSLIDAEGYDWLLEKLDLMASRCERDVLSLTTELDARQMDQKRAEAAAYRTVPVLIRQAVNEWNTVAETMRNDGRS